MTTIQTIHQYRCDLNQGPSEVTLKTPIMHQDALGDVFRVAVWRGNKVVDLTGMTVRGFLYFASTRQTLLLEGSITDGCACVTLTSECYAIPGYASLVVQVQSGDVRHSLLKVNMCITRTGSEIVIDPGDILPTLPELLGQIAAMEQATAEAREAAAAADAAREGIQGDLAALTEDNASKDAFDIAGVKYLPFLFIRGYTDYAANTVAPDVTYRATLKDFVSYPIDVMLSVKSGYTYNAFDDAGNLITATTSGKTLVPANTRFKVNIRKSPEDTNVAIDLNEAKTAITMETDYEKIRDNAFLPKGVIDSGIDFNSIVGMGCYVISASSINPNSPIDNAWKLLIVFHPHFDSDSGMTQTVYTAESCYVRKYVGGVWEKWVQMYGCATRGITNAGVTQYITSEELYAMNKENVGLAPSHSGAYKGRYPQCSPQAFVDARVNGFYLQSIDIQFTSDNVGVVMHDDVVKDVDGNEITIANCTMEELKQYKFGNETCQFSVMSFDEAALLMRDIGCIYYLDFKENNFAGVKAVYDWHVKRGLLHNVWAWRAYHIGLLTDIRDMNGSLRVIYAIETVDENRITYIRDLQTRGDGEVWVSHPESLNIDTIKDELSGMGVKKCIYTVNDKAKIIEYSREYDSIVSDDCNVCSVLYENAVSRYLT